MTYRFKKEKSYESDFKKTVLAYTGIIAVIGGQDDPSWSLLIGAILGIAASLISAFGDIREQKKRRSKSSRQRNSNARMAQKKIPI